MKIRILISAIIALLFLSSACKKEDSGPVLEGNFNGSFNFSDRSWAFYFKDVEQDGERLHGSFEFHDGSGYAQFTSSSKLVGDNLFIKFVAGSGSNAITFTFEGTVNSERTRMNGTNLTLKLSGYQAVSCGPWYASKSGSGGATGNEKSAAGTQYNLFLKTLQKTLSE